MGISKDRVEIESDKEQIEDYDTYGFPVGRVIVHEGVKYKAFTLEEYKEVAHLLVSYGMLWDEAEITETRRLSYEQERGLWLKRYEVWRQQCDMEHERGNIYLDLWQTETKIRLQIQRNQKLATWVPWTIVVLESIALATFGIYQAVK